VVKLHLKHETEYPIMQEQLNSILNTVNSYIIKKKSGKWGCISILTFLCS